VRSHTDAAVMMRASTRKRSCDAGAQLCESKWPLFRRGSRRRTLTGPKSCFFFFGQTIDEGPRIVTLTFRHSHTIENPSFTFTSHGSGRGSTGPKSSSECLELIRGLGPGSRKIRDFPINVFHQTLPLMPSVDWAVNWSCKPVRYL
jgi:hypothetical protein